MIYMIGIVVMFVAIFAYNTKFAPKDKKVSIGLAGILSLTSWYGLMVVGFALALVGVSEMIKKSEDLNINKFFRGEKDDI